jgi:hypothetical protein
MGFQEVGRVATPCDLDLLRIRMGKHTFEKVVPFSALSVLCRTNGVLFFIDYCTAPRDT